MFLENQEFLEEIYPPILFPLEALKIVLCVHPQTLRVF